MRTNPSHTRSRIGRLLAATVAAVTIGVLTLPTGAVAAPAQYSPNALAALTGAVDRSGVAGIAWYTDAATDRVIVTADSSVSSTEIATLKRAAGTYGKSVV